MRKLTFLGMAVGWMFGVQATAAEWIPIKQGDVTVREIDTTSIKRKGALVEFVGRHTFADKDEYVVGRREVKYLVITSRADCDSRTLAQLATAAYDEKMNLIDKQQIFQPQGSAVTPESIDESALDYICASAQSLK